jgi:hypothetical protein
MIIAAKFSHRRTGLTRPEWIAVISLTALLVLWMTSSPIGSHPAPSKQRVTMRLFELIELGLERYAAEFGEYPEPTNPDETIEIVPGTVYRIGGAKCLYQALSGDGFDAIKQVQGETPPQSDGHVSDAESKFQMVIDMPHAMYRKVGDHYFLVDAFGRPFQYAKADKEKTNTINSTYDLWSITDDDKHTLSRSKDAETSPGLHAKWIKNW